MICAMLLLCSVLQTRPGVHIVGSGALTVIVGLPGSGKSTLVEKMKREGAGFCVHDFHANAHMNSPLVEHSRHYGDLIRSLRRGTDCVIADIAFCEPARRDNLERAVAREIPALRIEWVYFENAPETCAHNIKTRARSSSASDLRELARLTALYILPSEVVPIPVIQAVRA